MFLLNTLSAALAISSSAVALSIPTVAEHSTNDATSKSSIYEKLSGPPAGWVRDDSTTINKDISTVKLRIQLMEQNMNKFHELAMNVCLTFISKALTFKGDAQSASSLECKVQLFFSFLFLSPSRISTNAAISSDCNPRACIVRKTPLTARD